MFCSREVAAGQQQAGVAGGGGGNSPRRTTPVPFNVDSDYLKMLKEAQRENSARSSARVSPISSAMMSLSSTCKNTPSASPKSPPNSPNTELVNFEENLKSMVVNRDPDALEDFSLSWRSRPNMLPPRSWRFNSSTAAAAGSKTSSGNQSDSDERKAEKSDLQRYSGALIGTNLLSLALGAFIGFWIFKNGNNLVNK